MEIKVEKVEDILKMYYTEIIKNDKQYTKAYVTSFLKVSDDWIRKNIQENVPYVKVSHTFLRKQLSYYLFNKSSDEYDSLKNFVHFIKHETIKESDEDFSTILFSIEDVMEYILLNSELKRRTILVNYADLLPTYSFKSKANSIRIERNNKELDEFSDEEVLRMFLDFTEIYPKVVKLPDGNVYKMQPFYYRSVVEEIEHEDGSKEKIRKGRADMPYTLLSACEYPLGWFKGLEVCNDTLLAPNRDYRQYELAYRDEILKGFTKIEFKPGRKTWFTTINDRHISKNKLQLYYPIRYDDYLNLVSAGFFEGK